MTAHKVQGECSLNRQPVCVGKGNANLKTQPAFANSHSHSSSEPPGMALTLSTLSPHSPITLSFSLISIHTNMFPLFFHLPSKYIFSTSTIIHTKELLELELKLLFNIREYELFMPFFGNYLFFSFNLWKLKLSIKLTFFTFKFLTQ